jgi:hypothetical protein
MSLGRILIKNAAVKGRTCIKIKINVRKRHFRFYDELTRDERLKFGCNQKSI